jgi:large subunit ribosomal protein L13e
LGVEFAKTIGITVDHRRKNRSQESFEANKARLTNYLSKLVLYPKHEGHFVTKAKNGILNDTPKVIVVLIQDQQTVATAPTVNTLAPLVKRVRSVSKLELERLRKSSAYRSIRQEWNNQRNEGQRQKKAREAAEKNN